MEGYIVKCTESAQMNLSFKESAVVTLNVEVMKSCMCSFPSADDSAHAPWFLVELVLPPLNQHRPSCQENKQAIGC
eukprot:3561023-Amphidinium_carterae.2